MSPIIRNGSRITVPIACAVAPNTLSGSLDLVVSVVVVVVSWGCDGVAAVVVDCTVLVCSDAQPGRISNAESSSATTINVPAFVMACSCQPFAKLQLVPTVLIWSTCGEALSSDLCWRAEQLTGHLMLKKKLHSSTSGCARKPAPRNNYALTIKV
jgi:hypothetical protein